MWLFCCNMKTVLITLVCAFSAVALLMVGLGVKILFKKHGEFKRHCSSMDPYTGERGGCVCGKTANVKCKKKTYDPLEVNEELRSEL